MINGPTLGHDPWVKILSGTTVTVLILVLA